MFFGNVLPGTQAFAATSSRALRRVFEVAPVSNSPGPMIDYSSGSVVTLLQTSVRILAVKSLINFVMSQRGKATFRTGEGMFYRKPGYTAT